MPYILAGGGGVTWFLPSRSCDCNPGTRPSSSPDQQSSEKTDYLRTKHCSNEPQTKGDNSSMKNQNIAIYTYTSEIYAASVKQNSYITIYSLTLF